MQINRETHQPNTIQSYNESQIKVNDTLYSDSVIISHSGEITSWSVSNIEQLDADNVDNLLQFNPEIILIGYQGAALPLPPQALQFVANHRVGIECMPIGAACRTFNVLLSEHRAVVLAIIFLK